MRNFSSFFVVGFSADNYKRYVAVIECGKRCQNILIGLKKELFGCFRIEEICDKDNETGLKEGGGIEILTTVLSIYAMHALFRI